VIRELLSEHSGLVGAVEMVEAVLLVGGVKLSAPEGMWRRVGLVRAISSEAILERRKGFLSDIPKQNKVWRNVLAAPLRGLGCWAMRSCRWRWTI